MNPVNDLDPAAIERLHRLGGDPFVARMIALFLNYGAEKLAEARKAQQAGEMGAVERAVHPIKSSAGNVGAMRMQQLATETEQCAKQKQAESVATLLDELEAAFQTVRPQLEAERARLTGPPGDG